ncbi:ATP-binding protein [Mesorhizobium sp. M0018]|uniref:AAA family ATPase n=1 Tax=Mesorhizobium sp. M0018 TaxID=2956844 RepID=UPI00333D31D1
MRLDRIKIGSAKDSPSHHFKNLKDVTIDFDQDHWVTVLIGWNGTGKSNVLEALAIIFRDLIMQKKAPAFAFVVHYRMGRGENTLHIEIDADPDRTKEAFVIHIASDAEARGVGTLIPVVEGELEISARRGKKITLNAFLKDDEIHFPRYVFSYYSGESPRMQEVFRPYLEHYDRDLRGGKDPGLKRLFYALPVHSQFVLLAFLIQQSEDVRTFLLDHLGIDPDEGIESVLFVLIQPPWSKKDVPYHDGDSRFWNARGVVSEFLNRLYDIALAPIEVSRKEHTSLWNDKTLLFKYLYVKDVDALRRLVGGQTPAQFFRDLESTHVSQLIDEVRIRIRLKQNDGSITFRELSEGEQQLITVLGLLRFTSESESLFLLDEPDTHLNPRWCVDYLTYLQKFADPNAGDQQTSHIVLTTHNPLAIAELVKEQVQILHREPVSRTVLAEGPAMDPRGMGFSGIVTSDMFGLGSSLDNATNDDLIELHRLSTKTSLTAQERDEMVELRDKLRKLDFNFAARDRLEQEYLRARFDLTAGETFESAVVTPENKQRALDALVKSLLNDLRESKK